MLDVGRKHFQSISSPYLALNRKEKVFPLCDASFDYPIMPIARLPSRCGYTPSVRHVANEPPTSKWNRAKEIIGANPQRVSTVIIIEIRQFNSGRMASHSFIKNNHRYMVYPLRDTFTIENVLLLV